MRVYCIETEHWLYIKNAKSPPTRYRVKCYGHVPVYAERWHRNKRTWEPMKDGKDQNQVVKWATSQVDGWGNIDANLLPND